jgi:phosphoenolpyruvate carboxykinase (GTP)
MVPKRNTNIDGADGEKRAAIKLKKRKNCFPVLFDPSDVARVENRTYISYPDQVTPDPPITGLLPMN